MSRLTFPGRLHIAIIALAMTPSVSSDYTVGIYDQKAYSEGFVIAGAKVCGNNAKYGKRGMIARMMTDEIGDKLYAAGLEEGRAVLESNTDLCSLLEENPGHLSSVYYWADMDNRPVSRNPDFVPFKDRRPTEEELSNHRMLGKRCVDAGGTFTSRTLRRGQPDTSTCSVNTD